MSGVFDTYEREYLALQHAIDEKISSEIAATAAPDAKKRLLNQAKREIEEAEEIISQMEMELVSLPAAFKPQLQPKVRTFKEDIKKAKKALASHTVTDRDLLLGSSASGANIDSIDGGSAQRSRMLQGTERLQEGSRRLEEARQLALETEAAGIDTLGHLNQQREQILKTKDRLAIADSFIVKSQGVLRKMHDTMMANKFLTYGIIAALILLILIVVYFKWFASSG